MKQFFIIFIIFLLTAGVGFSQTRKAPTKSVPVAEIQPFEWNELTQALVAENWDKSVTLTSNALKKLTAENAKRQMASLRYFYLFALAGKVQAQTASYAEFERVSQVFVGKQFTMPSRQISIECTGKVNYICTVPGSVMSLRVTSTNAEGNMLHFLEYYEMSDFFDINAWNRKQGFLNGKLSKVESEMKSGVRVIRLIFTDVKVEITKVKLPQPI